MKGSKDFFSAAGTKAALKAVTVELSEDEGPELFSDASTSFTGFGKHERSSETQAAWSCACEILSVGKIQASLKGQGAMCGYTEMELEGKEGQVKAAMFMANAFDVVCRDMDNMLKQNGEYANCNFTYNAASERLSLVAAEYKGGYRSK